MRRVQSKDSTPSAPATWEHRSTALEGAFQKLVSAGAADGISYDDSPLIARELLLMRPTTSRKSTHSPKEQLRYLAKTLDKAVNALDALSPEACRALNFRQAALRNLNSSLRILKIDAEHATPRPTNGRPKKASAKKIAERVGWHYWRLTGKRPKRRASGGVAYGPFLDLVKDVFKILGVTDSAENCARAAVDRLKAALPRG